MSLDQALLDKIRNNDPGLATLYFGGNPLDAADVIALCKALKHNTSLKRINLSDNSIGDAGAIALAELLHSNTSIEMIDLGKNQIGEIGVRALCEALKHNTSLKKIDLKNNPIGDAGAAALADALRNTSLEVINLWENQIGDAGAIVLFEALKHNSSLKSIYLKGNQISETGISAFCKALEHNTSLKWIDLGDNPIGKAGTRTLCKALKHNTSLKRINLSDNSIGDAGAIALAELLHSNTCIEMIDLGKNQIGEIGIRTLCKALKCNTSLKMIDLGHNSIREAGIKALSEVLNHNTSLEAIDLWENHIGDAGLKSLSEALKSNTYLKTIGLRDNNIGDVGAIALAEALKQNSNLEKIDVDNNKIGDVGAIALAEALKQNSSLVRINLWNNNIGDSGTIALAEALKHNTSLKTIDLGRNKVGDSGVVALCEMIIKNYTLLDLLGIEHPLISACLVRNYVVELVNAFNEYLVEALDSQVIKEAIGRVEKIIPCFDRLDDEKDYLLQLHRLLTGLEQMITQEGEIDALYCLSPVFTHPSLQKTADIALGHICSADIGLDTLTRRAFYQLGFYSLREELHRPELQALAWLALFKLSEPEKEFTMEAKEELEGKVALLSYKSLLILAGKALAECKSSLEKPEPEIQMLEALIIQDVYRPEMLSFLLQSPSFCLQFKKHAEGKTFLTLPEHCLFANNEDDCLIAIPETVNPVTEEQAGECCRVMSHRVEMPHEKPLAAIRKQIAEAIGIPDNVDSEHLFDKTEKEKEPPVDELAPGLDGIEIPLEEPAEEEYRQQFLNEHQKVFNQDRNRFFGCLRRTEVEQGWDLNTILKHAKERNNRSRGVCVALGWLQADGSLGSDAPESVKNAYQTACQEIKKLTP